MSDGGDGATPRRAFLARSGAALLAAGLPANYARLAAAVRPAQVPVRTITAGVNIARDDPTAALRRAAAFLDTARTRLETAGLTVQTTRIVTQPQGGYAGGLPAPEFEDLLRTMQAAAMPHALAIGPRALREHPLATVAGAVAAATAGVSATIVIAMPASGIRRRAVDAAATAIRRIADIDPAANFNFAAIANVGPGVPFFPAGYHDGGPDCFMLGTEAAGLFLSVCREVPDLAAAAPALRSAYDAALVPIAELCGGLAADTGWHFRGIDPTPAQWGDNSIGAAVEQLTGVPFGAPGTLAACRLLTSVVRSVTVPQAGFRGLFLPPMEDATLARRAYDHFGLDTLLACSAVCGTGLDTVALPGDAAVAALRRILLDVASLAVQWNKPLTARLFPVPGRSAGESTGPVGDLFPMKILRIH